MKVFPYLGTLALLVGAPALLAQEAKKEVQSPVRAPQAGKSQQLPKGKGGNTWFEVTNQELGTFFHHEDAVAKFKFKNPSGDPQKWQNLVGSCTCTKAIIRMGEREYHLTSKPQANSLFRVNKRLGGEDLERVSHINVEGDAEGEIEVHMEMRGITGVRRASLDFHMSDPKLPMVKLQWQATGATMFVLNPPEVNLNKMIWNEKREFAFQVRSPVSKDFTITGHDPFPPDMTVEYEKSMQGENAVWAIRGTYGPVKTEGGGGGVLKFYTDLKGRAAFQARVIAFIEGPLQVKPGGFVTLGMIRKGKGKTEEVTLDPNGDFDLQVTKIHFEKLTVSEAQAGLEVRKNGKGVVVELTISPDIKAGTLVRGDIVIELNHPAIKEKRILFNGFVR